MTPRWLLSRRCHIPRPPPRPWTCCMCRLLPHSDTSCDTKSSQQHTMELLTVSELIPFQIHSSQSHSKSMSVSRRFQCKSIHSKSIQVQVNPTSYQSKLIPLPCNPSRGHPTAYHSKFIPLLCHRCLPLPLSPPPHPPRTAPLRRTARSMGAAGPAGRSSAASLGRGVAASS